MSVRTRDGREVIAHEDRRLENSCCDKAVSFLLRSSCKVNRTDFVRRMATLRSEMPAKRVYQNIRYVLAKQRTKEVNVECDS